MELRSGEVEANGLHVAYLEAGDGPLALCLHGFPDSAWTWRHLLPALAAAGFRAVAPWQRGYAPTDVPDDGVYHGGALVADTVELHDALGGDGDAVLVGHDWGAINVYGAAAHAPDRWRRAVAMAVPPLVVMANGLLDYDQVRRSFYLFYFQTPLAEAGLTADDYAFVERLWRDWSPGYDATEDVARAKQSLGDMTNVSAAVGYYRAMFDPTGLDARYTAEQLALTAPTPQPLLYLHGDDDGCIGISLTDGLEAVLGPAARVVRVPGTGHFLHLEQPALVNRLVVEWLCEDRLPR